MSINVIFFFFVLHDQPALLIFKMAVKNQVNYLGVVITKNKVLRERENVNMLMNVKLFSTPGYRETIQYLEGCYFLRWKVCKNDLACLFCWNFGQNY